MACQPGILSRDNGGAEVERLVTEEEKACGQGRKLDTPAQGGEGKTDIKRI